MPIILSFKPHFYSSTTAQPLLCSGGHEPENPAISDGTQRHWRNHERIYSPRSWGCSRRAKEDRSPWACKEGNREKAGHTAGAAIIQISLISIYLSFALCGAFCFVKKAKKYSRAYDWNALHGCNKYQYLILQKVPSKKHPDSDICPMILKHCHSLSLSVDKAEDKRCIGYIFVSRQGVPPWSQYLPQDKLLHKFRILHRHQKLKTFCLIPAG